MMKISTTITNSKALLLGMVLASSLMLNVAAPAAEADKPVTIPDTPVAIMQSIANETEEMSKLIQAGTLKDLHHHAFAIRDLVAALPAHSAQLPAAKLSKVKAGSKFVATLAERLDAAGDADDKTASEANFGKLKNVLASIQANYTELAVK
jgi:CRISPR/Cas system CSM-associated protein Csm2 small subunit